MNMQMKFILIILSFFVGHQLAEAQEVNPVRWTFKANKISDQEYDLTFTASIQKGWHIFSQYLEQGGPWPTSLNFDLAPDYKLIALTNESGRKTEGYDALFGVNVIKYASRMTLSQKVTITESLEEINGYIQFMACNNEGCLPVTNYNFTFSFLE